MEYYITNLLKNNFKFKIAAAAAAKSLQSCPTLCAHRWQPTRLPVPGILQARTLCLSFDMDPSFRPQDPTWGGT